MYINVLNPAGVVEPNWKETGIKDIERVLKFTEGYQWSSHLDYLGKRGSLILDKGVLGELLPTPKAYSDLIQAVLEDKKYQEVAHLTFE